MVWVTDVMSWNPPKGYIAAPYEHPGPWNGGKDAAGDITPGAKRLGRDLQRLFPQIKSVGGYRVTPNSGNPRELSVHGTGRALDLMIKEGPDMESAGTKVADWLLSHAQEIGVQYVIWNGSFWGGTGRSGDYTGPNPHRDHVHVEITSDAGAMRTPYFKSPDSGGGDGSSGAILAIIIALIFLRAFVALPLEGLAEAGKCNHPRMECAVWSQDCKTKGYQICTRCRCLCGHISLNCSECK